MFFNRNAGDPTKWVVDFDTQPPGFNDNVDRNAIGAHDVADLAAQQVQSEPLRAVQQAERRGRRPGHADAGSAGPDALHARPHPDGHLGVALHEPAALRGRLGQLLREVRQLRAAHRRLDTTTHDLGRGTVLERHAAVRSSAASPTSIYRFNQPLQQGFEHHQIGTLAQMRASASYIPGAHSLKFGYQGNISHPSQELLQLHPVHSVPVQQRHPQSAHPDRHLPRHGEVPAQHPDDVVLRAGYLYACAPDAPGRRTLRRHRHQLPGRRRRWSGLPAHANAHLLPGGNDRRDPLEGHHAAHRRRVRPVRQRQDGNQGERRQVSDRAHREQQRPRPQPADPHDAPDDADVERHASTRLAIRDAGTTFQTATCGRPAPTASAARMDNQNFGKEIFTKSFDPDLIHGWGKRTYNWEMGVSRAAGAAAPRRTHCRLLPPLVRQLLHREQPPDDDGRLHAVQHPDSGGSAAARRRWRHGDGLVQPGAGHGRPGGSVLAALLELRRDDRELARRRRERQRAAAQRPHRARRHEHRPAAAGQLRRESGAARDLQLGEHHGRADDAGDHVDGRVGQPVVPRGRAVPDLVPRPGHLHRAEGRRATSASHGGATPARSSRPTTS